MEEEGKGLIFGIQHFSIHDGDGIRSNVFLKGCPLRCLWCHNPEGLSPKMELQYFENRCRKCGKCGDIYQNMLLLSGQPEDRKESYAQNCPYGALEQVGSYMTADQVLDEVRMDQEFFRTSRGGITLSGGEPMMQTDFVFSILKKAKKIGLSTAVETSGYSDKSDYERIYPYVDEFLWDCKETDSKKHKRYTGVDNYKIISNLRFLYDKGASITLRCPVIPGMNDTEEHFQGIARLLNEFEDLKGWEIMPYHRLGAAKEKRLGGKQGKKFSVPEKDTVEQWKQKINEYIRKSSG